TIAKSLGGDYQLTITPEDPALKNDPGINRYFKETIQNLYPQFKIIGQPFGMGGEDFAHMAQTVPGAMFFSVVGWTMTKTGTCINLTLILMNKYCRLEQQLWRKQQNVCFSVKEVICKGGNAYGVSERNCST